VLRVAGLDLLDGTPVLDLKPYLAPVESVPGASLGWLAAVPDEVARGPSHEVLWSAEALAQQGFLASLGVHLGPSATRVLGQDPLPGRHYRRVESHPEVGYQLALGSWRLRYRVEGSRVLIARVVSGYTPEVLAGSPVGSLEDDPAHRAFHLRWP
jgi:hypothetical protein